MNFEGRQKKREAHTFSTERQSCANPQGPNECHTALDSDCACQR